MIHWGFIGCGDVVERKSGKPFWKAGESDVVAVMCRNLDRAADFAARHGIAAYYNKVEALVNDPAVDAIYIATPPSTHMPYATLAVAAGKPVYVEKPMGVALPECTALLQLAQQKQVPVFVAYYRRALPYYHKVKELLDSGAIGQVRSVNLTYYTAHQPAGAPSWRVQPSISGGGLFHDVGCHALDILDFLMGEIVAVSGSSANLRHSANCDDTVAAQMRFANGALGTALWCFGTATSHEQIEVLGDGGSLIFHIMGNEIALTQNGETQQIAVPHPAYVQQGMVHNVIASLQGTQQPACTGAVAYRTALVMDRILQTGYLDRV